MLQAGLANLGRASAPDPQVEGKFYLVTITDTGTGIPLEDLAHVFDRFYRVDKSRRRASGGSGLGLAIARHFVEAHGGRIWAESPVYYTAPGAGYGTRLSFTIPVHA